MANFFNSDFFRKICPIISKIFKTKVTQKNSFEVENRAKYITPPPNSFFNFINVWYPKYKFSYKWIFFSICWKTGCEYRQKNDFCCWRGVIYFALCLFCLFKISINLVTLSSSCFIRVISSFHEVIIHNVNNQWTPISSYYYF